VAFDESGYLYPVSTGDKDEEKPGVPKPTAARFALAANLNHLMDNYVMGFEKGITPPQLAKGCRQKNLRVSVKTIRRMKNPYETHSPNLDSIDAVAAFFNVTAWDMVTPRAGQKPLMQGTERPMAEPPAKKPEGKKGKKGGKLVP